jgi:hypothetical protein
VFKWMCKLFKIEKLCTTAYHPESNGALERTHKTLTNYLQCFCDMRSNNWTNDYPSLASHIQSLHIHLLSFVQENGQYIWELALAPPVPLSDDIVMVIKQNMQNCQQTVRDQ